MNRSFTEKTLRITLNMEKDALGTPHFTKEIEGLACTVDIQKPGLPQKNSARVTIWGLKQENMARLTNLAFKPLESRHNTISILAGTRGEGLSLAFTGEISLAYADFNQAPDPCMIFEADSSSYAAQIAQPATTINGEASVEMLLASFAREAGYTLRNEGVTNSVANICLPGSPVGKIMKLTADIGCELIIDDGAVIVLPANKARFGEPVFLSAKTGLIGYPTFTQDGISCRCLYNPVLQYGGLISTESIVPGASGTWKITRLSHSLAAYRTGPWESQVEASYYHEQR